MSEIKLISETSILERLVVALDRREVALWIGDLTEDLLAQEQLAELIGLPWKLVLSETSYGPLVNALEKSTSVEDQMTKKRGFIQVVDGDPSKSLLPPRCLPVYLLNGREGETPDQFVSRLRRMNMMEQMRRSGVRQLIVLGEISEQIENDLSELWNSGFHPYLNFLADSPAHESRLSSLPEKLENRAIISIVRLATDAAIRQIIEGYLRVFPDLAKVVRIRDVSGNIGTIDVAELDDPERPILDRYDVIEAKDLLTLTPAQLTRDEFTEFFQNPSASWLPYAAGLPWLREEFGEHQMEELVGRLDSVGSEENCVAYIVSEPGAGGTTAARSLAWRFAAKGYPVLTAKHIPFTPEALGIGNFLNRVKVAIEKSLDSPDENQSSRRYETPWILVFDRLHWEHRDTQLSNFVRELNRQGRPVCVLVVSGPIIELAYYDTSLFKKIGTLSHSVDQDEVRALGTHLNSFLRSYGLERDTYEWDSYYRSHTVEYIDGVSTFWVALSFWIQREYDLSESLQTWLYNKLREGIDDPELMGVIMEIAALSTERLAMPEGLFPISHSEWPISVRLEDKRTKLGAIGLTRVSVEAGEYWALVHDVLGRFLVNALFHDISNRELLHTDKAKDQEHLRLLLLSRISARDRLGELGFRDLGEKFATRIFKLDPDHGHAQFLPYWREVFEVLDQMPLLLRNSSRAFRHHTAVSRRRICKLENLLIEVKNEDKLQLLERAVEDVRYGLDFIDYSPGSEPDLNLYNTLARAYFDLADVREKLGSDVETVEGLRRLANDATKRAYEENPTNSFVIETYITNLLVEARTDLEVTTEKCLEALGVLYSAISSNEEAYRKAHLGDLADKALSLLISGREALSLIEEPASPTELLCNVWLILTRDVQFDAGEALASLPIENRLDALRELQRDVGRGNIQVTKLQYDLTCSTLPYDFRSQLEMAEQIVNSEFRSTPQLKLEYGVLLYQNDRMVEGDEEFGKLRRLWRETDQFVSVPQRLRWLRVNGLEEPRRVSAVVSSDYGGRGVAKVREFQHRIAHFRPHEFGLPEAVVGTTITCLVSFGHNGPFLRPVTSRTN